ncbi:MAG: TniQ family protein [Rhodobacteraceae bacterium]|nr:TniQ family protein [Paracoccaceae bacterium]
MVDRLQPNLPFVTDETPVSYASRLAAFHTAGSMSSFLTDFGIKAVDLAGGVNGSLERLAEITGADLENLRHNALHRLARRRYSLRGEQISAEVLRGQHTAVCPACLRADDAAGENPAAYRRARVIWQLRPVRTCPVHGLPLMELRSTGSNDVASNLAFLVPKRGAALDRLIAETTARECSPLQDYVIRRLGGEQGPAWLDSQTLEQAVRASEMLGVLLEFGPTPNLHKFTSCDWDRAGRTGFSVAAQGEAGIRDALGRVNKSFQYSGSKPGPQKVYGRLYQWLAHAKGTKSPGDIKRILREHIFDTMEFAEGETVLGAKLDRRRLHSVASLAKESNQDTRTLRHMLIARGLVSDDPDAGPYHVFDAEVGRAVAASISRIVHVIALPKALNCTRPQASQLLDERILTPLADGVVAAPGRIKKAVDERQIDVFLKDLSQAASTVEEVPIGMVPIAKAAEKASSPSVEILHLILGGFLQNAVRLNDVEGLRGIYVDPDEVRTVTAEVMVGLSPAEAFGRLKVPSVSGWALADDGPDGVILPSIRIEGPNGRHVFRRFREEDVAACMAKFTTRPRIANALGLDFEEVRNRLISASVKPAFWKRHIGIDLYHIPDLPETCRP